MSEADMQTSALKNATPQRQLSTINFLATAREKN
jgi:hypothetical protein